MMEDFLWKAFKETGDVRYYILMKRIINGGYDGDKESKRESI